jgi:hypothetical protein
LPHAEKNFVIRMTIAVISLCTTRKLCEETYSGSCVLQAGECGAGIEAIAMPGARKPFAIAEGNSLTRRADF